MVVDEDTKDILFRALRAAEANFESYIEAEGYDPSYFELYLEGWVLSCDFKRMVRITIDNSGSFRSDK